MFYTSDSIERVVDCFSSLPTIGRKTAQRLTYFLLAQNNEFVEKFADSLTELKKNVHYCSSCHNYTETDPCPICASDKRDKSIICIVEEPNDVTAIEKANIFNGVYHVLHGLINPLDKISPSDIKISELIARLKDVKEVIFALNSEVEGEITTQYIARLIKPLGIKMTRLARGLPMGSELEYTDEATISLAIESRIDI